MLEATVTVIVDGRHCFEEMGPWTAADRSRRVEKMITAIAPAAGNVAEFETAIRDLFPPRARLGRGDEIGPSRK